MDVLLKTADQIEELLGGAFALPDGCVYQAVFDGANVLVGVDEPGLATAWVAVGLGALCDVLSRLISESQRSPGVPVAYGPRGVERRSRARLELVS